MINYFNFRKFKNKILITNDTGNYAFLANEEFKKMFSDNLDRTSEKYAELTDKFFVYDENQEVFLERIKHTMRSSKAFLFHATSLHIFVVTNMCNAECVYCQAKDVDMKDCGKMTIETAKRSVDLALEAPEDSITFEFQGGEPLVNFDVIKYIIEYSKEVNKNKKEITYSIVSNISLMTDDMLDYLVDNDVGISTSLDGHHDLHNKNRPLKNNEDAFELVMDGIEKIKSKGINVSAIQTTTKYSLAKHKDIIDAYLDAGINSLFIRPLTPLGMAYTAWIEIGYEPKEFITFYRNCINYLIELNKQGIFVKEGHASIFLNKILNCYSTNYMELRSPCGASVGQVAYYYDGNIYTCDEGRMLAAMGDNSFKLGNVNDNISYDDLINSPVCKAVCSASCLEAIPTCSDCVYQPYCGTCPVINLAEGNDIFPKMLNNYRCQIYSGMLDIFFEILERNDKNEINILKSWL